MNKLNMTGAILAGGKSRRMGYNKAFIPTAEGPIIERTVRIMSSIFEIPFIVATQVATYNRLGVPVYPDIIAGGSLGGIYTALSLSEKDNVFVTACDMPWLDDACIRAVALRAGKVDCVVPFIGGRLHPMHAAYSRRCLDAIEKMIKGGNFRINSLFDRIDALRLTEKDFTGLPIERSVENVNTEEDLLRAGLDGK